MNKSKSDGCIPKMKAIRVGDLKQKKASKRRRSFEMGMIEKISPKNIDLNEEQGKSTSRIRELRKYIYQLILVGIVGMAFINFGFNLAVLSPMTTQTKECGKEEGIVRLNGNYFKTCVELPADYIWTICIAIFSVGASIGALLGGLLAEKLGRRRSTLLVNILGFLPGYIMMMLTSHYIAIIVSRIIVGIAAGMISTITPMLLVELVSSKRRGTFGMILQVCIMGGYFMASLVALLIWNKPHGLRYIYIPVTIITILQTIALSILVPNSPQWMATRNIEASKRILKRLHRSSSIERLEKQCKDDKEQKQNIVCSKKIIRPLLVGEILMIGRQWCGMNAFIFYSYPIIKHVGIEDPIIGMCIFAGMSFLLAIGATFFMDLTKRKYILLIGESGMAISLCMLSLFQILFQYTVFPSVLRGILSLSCLIAFVGWFQLSLGSIPFFAISDLTPDRMRSFVVGCSTMGNWISSFLASLATPLFQTYLGPYAFIPWIIATLCTLTLTFLFYPDKRIQS